MAQAVKDRIVSADGWVGAPWAPEHIESDWEDVRDHAEANDRDPDSLDRSVVNYVHVVPDAGPERAEAEQHRVFGDFVQSGGLGFANHNYLTGTVEDICEQLTRYQELGMEEAVLFPVVAGASAQERQLELIADLIKPQFP